MDKPDGRCFFCKRWQPILDGTYTRIKVKQGTVNVCDDCREKADPDEPIEYAVWRDTEVEVV